MQRRFAITLVATALASITFVGVGVLAIAQFGARDRAVDNITQFLETVADSTATDPFDRATLANLVAAVRGGGQPIQVEVVAIESDGSVWAMTGRPGRRRGQDRWEAVNGFTVDLEQQALIRSGDDLVVTNNNTVYGIHKLGEDAPEDADPLLVGVLARQQIVAIPQQTFTWFVASSLVVLLGAMAAGIISARRLARPIREIEAATSAIAAGDLAT